MNIGDRIRELRIERGFSQDDLALHSGFSKSYIQKFEDGQREIKSSQLIELSYALKVSISDIINKTNYVSNEFVAQNIEFREAYKFEMGTDYLEKKIRAVLHEKYPAYVNLEKILNESIDFQNPLKDIEKITKNNDVEEAAKKLRKKWKFEITPIYDLIIFLEDLGIKIFEVTEDENFVGFSCWIKATPIIVINTRSTDISRRRFTVFHELAHLLLKFEENEKKENIERFCDQFAGAMLLPSEILKSYVNTNVSISLEELKRIKSKYGISIVAILVRMVNVGLINWNTYNSWKATYNSWENKESEYGGVENTGRFNYLLAKGLREQKISKGMASKLSNLPITKLKKEFIF